MRMFKSFLLRLALILATTADICLFLMTVTLGIQGLTEGTTFTGMLFGLVSLWLVVNLIAVRRIDPVISLEVARLVWPAGAVLSLLLSIYLAFVLEGMIPGSEGNQHIILIFVGIGVMLFLMIRCFDIKWLRGEEEIVELEDRGD